jgi:hypothetical protein
MISFAGELIVRTQETSTNNDVVVVVVGVAVAPAAATLQRQQEVVSEEPPRPIFILSFFFLSFSTIGRIDGRQREREREREKFYDVQFPADFGREEKRKRHVAAGFTNGRTVVVKIRKTKKNFSHFCLKKNLKKKKCFFFFFSFQKCPGRLYIYFTVL